MGMSNSDVLRKCWWNLSLNATTIFRILYGTQDYVPYEELVKHLYSDDLEKILGWIGRSIEEAGGGTWWANGWVITKREKRLSWSPFGIWRE